MRLGERHPALLVVIVGAVMWGVTCAVTAITDDTILVPTVILGGSFLVPAAVVTAALVRVDRQRDGAALDATTIVLGFFAGGAVGVVLAGLLETYLLPSQDGTFLVLGIIEEATKAVIVMLVAWRVATRRPLDGMVLGAVVGAGFAAFESSGYAFDAYLQHGAKHPFLDLLQTELSRALSAPFGHVIWTAILGGALFAACRGRSFRVTVGMLGTFAGVVLLHTAWDASYGWSIILTKAATGHGFDLSWPSTSAWVGQPSRGQLVAFDAIYYGFIAAIGGIGLYWFLRRWRQYSRSTDATNPLPQGRADAEGLEPPTSSL
jgi:RsiW-degrading membrane proteinase PrsW (M82 family)